MTLLPSFLVALLGLACSIAAVKQEVASYNLKAKGVVISSRFRGPFTTIKSQWSCYWTHCRSPVNCVVQWNAKSGQCGIVKKQSQSLIPALSKAGILFKKCTDVNWMVVVSSNVRVIINGPAAFWFLDNVNRGVNFGSKGAMLNLNTKGLVWASVGPRGTKSANRYAQFTNKNEAKFKNLQCGDEVKYGIDFKKPFTLAVWVKTTGKGIMPIVDGMIGNGFKEYQFHFWFYSNPNNQQLFVNLGTKDKVHFTHWFSGVDKSVNRNNWRHVAMTYDGVRNVDFYQNGKLLPKSKNIPSLKNGISVPTVLHLGFRFYEGKITNRFIGSMACFSAFERKLNQKEIAVLMGACA